MTESIQIPPNVDPLIVRGVLLSRLHDGLVALDAQKFADLVQNPIQPRDIAPVRHRRPPTHIRAVVEDPYSQASPQGPVSRPAFGPAAASNPLVVGSTAEGGFRATSDPSKTVCDCGMGYKGVPHPCMRWHHKMMTPQAKADFIAVVKKHCGGYIPEPTLSLDLMSEDTRAYIARVVLGGTDATLVKVTPPALTELLGLGLHTDSGERLTLRVGAAGPYGVTDIVITKADDPDWVKAFAKKHEEKRYAMPVCCSNPDPRIAKNGRPYCHSCKKYLDRVPPPQTAEVTVTRPHQRPTEEATK